MFKNEDNLFTVSYVNNKIYSPGTHQPTKQNKNFFDGMRNSLTDIVKRNSGLTYSLDQRDLKKDCKPQKL